MCQIVYVVKKIETLAELVEPEEIGTVLELIDFIGEENIVVSANYRELDQYSCLCQVDLEETFKKAGVEYKQDGMDWYVTKNNVGNDI